MRYLYLVEVAPGLRYQCVGEDRLHLQRDDEVIVRCDRYIDCGRVLVCYEDAPADEQKLRAALQKARKRGERRIEGWCIPVIQRRTTLQDKSRLHENEAREAAMFRTCQEKVEFYRLPMKLISWHGSFDLKLIVCQFTADGRVDFRDLVQDLSRSLHARIELRQIGVRDEAAILGGIGPCGRPFCCSAFLTVLESVNVRMAKEQGLSLNPAGISGCCGRLKCCLRYECEGYREMRKFALRDGSRCETPLGAGKVLDTNLLTGRVRVRLEHGDHKVQVFDIGEVRRHRAAEQGKSPEQNKNAKRKS